MDLSGFRKYLKKKGKKQNVVDNIIRSLEYSANYIAERLKKDLNDLQKTDLDFFYGEHKNEKQKLKNHLRCLALYLNFASFSEIAAYAYDLREKEISSSRKALKLSELYDINVEYLKKLEDEGIKNIVQMTERGKNENARRNLSEKLNIPYDEILKLVKLSDLCRIPGIKATRSRLYCEAGIDTMDKLSEYEAEELRNHMVKYVKNSNFNGIAPLPKEIEFTIKMAKELEKLVDYS